MSMDLFLSCSETRQEVPLGSYSASSGPSGDTQVYSGLLIKMFVLAHKGFNLVAAEAGDESICWDLPSCIELYERMTQQRVSDSFAVYVAEQCHKNGLYDGTWLNLEMTYELDPEKFKSHRIGQALRPRSDYMKQVR
jgi:hypothetical protein